VISEINRITRKDGYFYAQLPTRESITEYHTSGAKRERKELGTHVPFEGPEKDIPHHSFTKRELYELMKGFGFEIKEMCEKDRHYNILAVREH